MIPTSGNRLSVRIMLKKVKAVAGGKI